MAGKVKGLQKIDTPTARGRIKGEDLGRQPFWVAVHGFGGKVHLGWQRYPRERDGRWVMRRYVGESRYRTAVLGLADDAQTANGREILTYDQAIEAVQKRVGAAAGAAGVDADRMTVRQAIENYFEYKRQRGQADAVKDAQSRATANIYPDLGNLTVSRLDVRILREWLFRLAQSPAQNRPKKDGKAQYRDRPAADEQVRRRRASANRVLTILKAALNHSAKKLPNRDAWGTDLEPFEGVEVARLRYLSMDEARRLINACDEDFRPLVRAALETGCRYSELARLEVTDFNEDADTIHIRQSKSGKERHINLPDAAAAFFRQHCTGRTGLMFTHAEGKAWKKSEQARPMRIACANARIIPEVGFHQLRHTWASHAVMNGMPLMVAAKVLGHANTNMVQKHYGHLSRDYITEAIRTHAPVYGITEPEGVVPLRARKSGRTNSSQR